MEFVDDSRLISIESFYVNEVFTMKFISLLYNTYIP